MIFHDLETLIDHIYITNLEKHQESHVVQFSVSDHYPVCMTRSEQISVKKDTHISIVYRMLKSPVKTISELNEIALFSSNSNLSIHSTSSLGFL
jgi:hypothetical protein